MLPSDTTGWFLLRTDSFSFCAFSLSISRLLTYRSRPQRTPHQRVHERTEEDAEGSDAGTQSHLVSQEEDGEERLDASLGRSRDVVSERRGQTDLRNRHNSDEEAEDASQIHNAPEEERLEPARILPNGAALEDDDERNKQDDAVRVVLEVRETAQTNVKAQLPAIVINNGNHLLCADTVERNEERGEDAKKGSHKRKVDLSVRSNEEAENHNQTAHNHLERRTDIQEQITRCD